MQFQPQVQKCWVRAACPYTTCQVACKKSAKEEIVHTMVEGGREERRDIKLLIYWKPLLESSYTQEISNRMWRSIIGDKTMYVGTIISSKCKKADKQLPGTSGELKVLESLKKNYLILLFNSLILYSLIIVSQILFSILILLLELFCYINLFLISCKITRFIIVFLILYF